MAVFSSLTKKQFPSLFIAAELAWTDSAQTPPSGPPAPPLLLPAPHPSLGQTLQEKPGPDQLPWKCFGPGVRNSSKTVRTESRGRVKVKAAAFAQPSARAGEKYRDTHLQGHSGFWNAEIQSEMLACCVVVKQVYIVVLQVIFKQMLQMKHILGNTRMFVVVHCRK